jgi:hypothetical protein
MQIKNAQPLKQEIDNVQVQDEWKLTLRLSGFRADETGMSSRLQMLRNVEIVVVIGEEHRLPAPTQHSCNVEYSQTSPARRRAS